MLYPAKKDPWIVALVFPGALIQIFTFPLLLAPPPLPLPLRLLFLLLPVTGFMILWMLFWSSYEITASEMIARLGPIRWRVPLDAIEEITSTRGFRLMFGMGLAWSLDMLHIKYRKKPGGWAQTVSISPRDKAGFVEELARAMEARRQDSFVDN